MRVGRGVESVRGKGEIGLGDRGGGRGMVINLSTTESGEGDRGIVKGISL